jgi:hypothetical protein
MPRTATALAIAVIAAACSSSPPPSAEPHAGHSASGSPTTPTGEAHGAHSAGASGTPHPSAHEGSDGTIVLPDEIAMGGSGVSVAEALEMASSQPVLVNGVLLRDADGGIWFCERLDHAATPPACGHPSLWVTNFPSDESVFAPENARGTGSQTESGVTWIPNQQLYGVVHPAP